MDMTSEAAGPDHSTNARHDAASGAAHAPLVVATPSSGDAGLAIGYEAADPALQAPWWSEAMLAASRSLR